MEKKEKESAAPNGARTNFYMVAIYGLSSAVVALSSYTVKLEGDKQRIQERYEAAAIKQQEQTIRISTEWRVHTLRQDSINRAHIEALQKLLKRR